MFILRSNNYFKIINFLIIFPSFLFPKTSFPGMDIFSSSIHLSMGGAGYLKASSLSSNTNPSIFESKMFSASIIKYPAGIVNQNIGFTMPFQKHSFTTFLINHVSYGTFEGYSEDFEPTGTYNSSDTKICASYGKRLSKFPINFGMRSSFYLSNYENYSFNILSLSTGFIIRAVEQKIKLGLSIHDIAISTGDLIVELSPKVVISGSKNLKYLPLSLYIDLTSKDNSDFTVFIGGEFNLSKSLQLRFGSSTKKFQQNIEKDLFSSFAGASGFGFGYETKEIIFNYGVYVFGTGTTSQSLEINIRI